MCVGGEVFKGILSESLLSPLNSSFGGFFAFKVGAATLVTWF